MKPYDVLRWLDDAGLDAYQRSMMVHFWRKGQSWESIRTLAEATGMSIGKASQTRQWLLENGWIRWQPVQVNRNEQLAIVLCSPHEQLQQLDGGERSPDEQLQQINGCNRSPDEQQCSPGEQEPVVNVHQVNAILDPPNDLNKPTEIAPPPLPPSPEPFPFKPSPVESKVPSPAEERMQAILEVCQLDESVPAHKRQAENAAAQLSGYSADYILDRYGSGGWWFLNDWRGKRGDPPTTNGLIATISIKEPSSNGRSRASPKDDTPEWMPEDIDSWGKVQDASD